MMKAWQLSSIRDVTTDSHPLDLVSIDRPRPHGHEILIKVSVCGVCHTELDEIEGRTPPPKFPVIPGHQVVGTVEELGEAAHRFQVGDRVGVAWIHSACGECEFCKDGCENLCAEFRATGRDRNGGYAEFMIALEDFTYIIPANFSDAEAAPLLCAGAIGYRSLKLTNLRDGETLGLTGFGSSGHLVLKMARHLLPTSEIVVFARSKEEQKFAIGLGARWAGDISENPPLKPKAIIDTTPVWNTVVGSLLHLKPGGRLVINAIRKENQDLAALLNLKYEIHLWQEKEIKSVANITRCDVEEFLKLAAEIPIVPEVELYSFERANTALIHMKLKHIQGAKIIQVQSTL